jgi:hypothetical protein
VVGFVREDVRRVLRVEGERRLAAVSEELDVAIGGPGRDLELASHVPDGEGAADAEPVDDPVAAFERRTRDRPRDTQP